MLRPIFFLCFAGLAMSTCEEQGAMMPRDSEISDWKQNFPEMPGDEYERLSREIQHSAAQSFLSQRFILVEQQINPLEGIRKIFDGAGEAPRLVRPYDQEIKLPEFVFGDLLLETMEGQTCSLNFDYRSGDTPNFCVSQMLAKLCAENQIDIISASQKRFEFGLRDRPTVSKESHPLARAAEAHGLRLRIQKCEHRFNGIRIEMMNDGGKAVEVGLPGAAHPNAPWNPICRWSMIPLEKSGIYPHPYGVCEDLIGSGCGTGWMSFSGEVLRIEPGTTVDITNQIGLPDVIRSQKVDGLFRAKLYFLNYSETPFRGAEWYSSESERARIVSRQRRTLSCYLESNEIQLEAVSRYTLHREHQKKLAEEKVK